MSACGELASTSAPCRRPGSRCRKGGGWVCTPWHPGKQHDCAVPALACRYHSAFDLVGVSHPPPLVYPVCAGGCNPLGGTMASSGKGRLTSLLHFHFALEPHNYVARPNGLQRLSPFNPSRSRTAVVNKARVSQSCFPISSMKNKLYSVPQNPCQPQKYQIMEMRCDYYDVTSEAYLIYLMYLTYSK